MFSEAEGFYQKALGEASAIKDEEGEAIASGNLSITYLHRSLYDRARRMGEDALKNTGSSAGRIMKQTPCQTCLLYAGETVNQRRR